MIHPSNLYTATPGQDGITILGTRPAPPQAGGIPQQQQQQVAVQQQQQQQQQPPPPPQLQQPQPQPQPQPQQVPGNWQVAFGPDGKICYLDMSKQASLPSGPGPTMAGWGTTSPNPAVASPPAQQQQPPPRVSSQRPPHQQQPMHPLQVMHSIPQQGPPQPPPPQTQQQQQQQQQQPGGLRHILQIPILAGGQPATLFTNAPPGANNNNSNSNPMNSNTVSGSMGSTITYAFAPQQQQQQPVNPSPSLSQPTMLSNNNGPNSGMPGTPGNNATHSASGGTPLNPPPPPSAVAAGGPSPQFFFQAPNGSAVPISAANFAQFTAPAPPAPAPAPAQPQPQPQLLAAPPGTVIHQATPGGLIATGLMGPNATILPNGMIATTAASMQQAVGVRQPQPQPGPPQQLQPAAPLRQGIDKSKRKTKMCTYWQHYGHCGWGDECAFAHGPEELANHNNNNNMVHHAPGNTNAPGVPRMPSQLQIPS